MIINFVFNKGTFIPLTHLKKFGEIIILSMEQMLVKQERRIFEIVFLDGWKIFGKKILLIIAHVE